MSGIDLAIDNLKNQVNDLRQQFSLARKKGIDVSIAHMKFLNLPAKIGVAEATKSLQDIKKANIQLEDVKKELEEAQHDQAKKQKQHDDKNYMQKVQQLFSQADEASSKKDWQQMLKIYVEIRGLYPFVPDAVKKETYKRSLELYNTLLSIKRGVA